MDAKFVCGASCLMINIKDSALKLLSIRPRSVEELRGRLKLKKYAAGEIEEVLAMLQRQGLLDDEKFAKFFANSRVYSRPAGKKQLAFELGRQGLSSELVSKTLENLKDYNEKETAGNLVRLRFQKMKGLTRQKKQARIYSFLKRRGFETDTIFAVMESLFKESEMPE